MFYAGDGLTDYLMKMPGERGYSFTPSAELKKNHAFPYVAEDFEGEMTKQKHHLKLNTIMNYKMDKQIQLKMERYRFCCPEVLFKPSLIGKESQGMHKFAYDSIIQRDLYTNTVLSGGTTMFRAIDARLTKKIKQGLGGGKSGAPAANEEDNKDEDVDYDDLPFNNFKRMQFIQS